MNEVKLNEVGQLSGKAADVVVVVVVPDPLAHSTAKKPGYSIGPGSVRFDHGPTLYVGTPRFALYDKSPIDCRRMRPVGV